MFLYPLYLDLVKWINHRHYYSHTSFFLDKPYNLLTQYRNNKYRVSLS